MDFRVRSDKMLSLPLRDFAQEFAKALVPLLRFLRDDELRSHPVWGELFPFDVPAYGTDPSLGHCVRLDVVLTEDGPQVCEMDFVPSGRGLLLAALESKSQRAKYLAEWVQWYLAMGARQRGVFYATGDRTICDKETQAFVQALMHHDARGVRMRAVSIAREPVNGEIVDRLFYRSELHSPEVVDGRTVITAEPWLDSKMVFALAHDPAMERRLVQVLGLTNLVTLREAFPLSFPLTVLRAQRHATLVYMSRHPGDWLLKNTDVEGDDTWGSRGVVLGRKYTKDLFADALFGDVLQDDDPYTGLPMRRRRVSHKNLGRQPIVQRYALSADFREIWDGIVGGSILRARQAHFGLRDEEQGSATSYVHARVGIYVLVDNVGGTVRVPPHGLLTLRQDALAHGASDALFSAFALE